MKNKFLQISIGVTLMLWGAGFFVRSFNTANAEPSPKTFLTEGTSQIGKYMVDQQIVTLGEYRYYYFLVWNTETGASKYYNYDYTAKKIVVADWAQLPTTPL